MSRSTIGMDSAFGIRGNTCSVTAPQSGQEAAAVAREQYEVHWKDYYEILQVHPRAEAEIIAAAYRKLAQLYHPDRNKDPSATQRFQQINEAYEVLSSAERRALYDRAYAAQLNASAPSSPAGDTHTDEPFRYGDHKDGADDDEDDAEDADEGWREAPYQPSDWGRARNYQRPRESERPRTDEPQREEKRAERSEPPSFVARLVFAPWEDESQRILPWPSWAWQRLILLAAIPLGGIAFIVAAAQGAWPVAGLAAALFAGTLYAGMTTRWLADTDEAPHAGRVVGGACIALSGASYAAAIAYIVFWIVIIVLALILVLVVLGVFLKVALSK